jgi:hypothetical protein
MTGDRQSLDVYLRSVNEDIQTTKISSELWFRSPSQNEIRKNDRFVRSLVGMGLGWATSSTTVWSGLAKTDPDQLRSTYWGAAHESRGIAVHFGASGHRTLGEYFSVDAGRSGVAALARAQQAVTASSSADYLLRSIVRLSAVGNCSPGRSCRRAMVLLSHDWPELIRVHCERSGPVLSAADLIRDFHDSVEAGTAQRRGTENLAPSPSADNASVLLTAAEATQLAATYMLGKYCYTAQEFFMAKSLVAMPRLQSALLAMHLHLTAGSLEPLGRLLSGFGTQRVLLPFTEAFVNCHGYRSSRLGLSPNPKLLTVLCNNVVPAIAGELLRMGASARDLDSDAIRAGVVAARRRQVFEIMIALFDKADTLSLGAVALSGFSTRVCPALVPFYAFLKDWLPYYFECFP